jgi:hypothetical protein
MTESRLDADSIGPQLDLDDVALPPAVGERLAALLGRESRIDTCAEWAAAMRSALADSAGRTPTVEDLCTSDDGDHAFEGTGERQSYACVLDPLIYPFLTDAPGTVRSETPVRGETVEIEIGDGAAISHDEAVVSLGVSDRAGTVDDVTVETVYRQVCGYVRVFADREEYEQWAADAAAATTAVPVDEGVAIARELAATLFE